MKLSAKGMKALKVIHLICIIVWLGSSISLNLLRYLAGNLDAAGMYWMARILEIIDMKILVPGAVGCLFTGIVYGFFTNWGFFRHRWLTVKWVLTVFLILFGTFYTGPLIKENVLLGKAIMEGCGDAVQYMKNVHANMAAGLMQVLLLLAITVISVYKPWKRSAVK